MISLQDLELQKPSREEHLPPHDDEPEGDGDCEGEEGRAESKGKEDDGVLDETVHDGLHRIQSPDHTVVAMLDP